jgi:hypothetical protein
MIQESTKVSISRALLGMFGGGKGDKLKAQALKGVRVDMEVSRSPSDYALLDICFTMPDGRKQHESMKAGDTFSFAHYFEFSESEEVNSEQVFPVTLEYKGQKYILQKTKQGKLILTK